MSELLTSVPNVSMPEVPCGFGMTAVWVPDPSTIPGREGEPPEWLCFSISECPTGTRLYVAPGPVEWRTCTADIAGMESLHGPNQALLPVGPVASVPALDDLGLTVLIIGLAWLGVRGLR